jgi:hypothetical protein
MENFSLGEITRKNPMESLNIPELTNKIPEESYNVTVLTSKNPDVVKACSVSIMGKYKIERVEFENETKFTVHILDNFPHHEVKETSRKFPDEVITCKYFSSINDYSEVSIVEYRNGENKLKAVNQQYHADNFPLINKKDLKDIRTIAAGLCGLFDKTKTDKDGNPFINWYEDEVHIKFEHEGIEGKEYRIEIIKHHATIHYKVFENLGNNDWREVTQNYSEEDIINTDWKEISKLTSKKMC